MKSIWPTLVVVITGLALSACAALSGKKRARRPAPEFEIAMLEEHANGGSAILLRALFEKQGRAPWRIWEPSVDEEGSLWHLCAEGRVRGAIAAHEPRKIHELSPYVLDPVDPAQVPTAVDRTFQWPRETERVRRPLLAVRKPPCPSPLKWKEVSPRSLNTLDFDALGLALRRDVSQRPVTGGAFPNYAFQPKSFRILSAWQAPAGELVLKGEVLRINDPRDQHSPKRTQEWIFVSRHQQRTFIPLGSDLKWIESGDFDADGEPDILFALTTVDAYIMLSTGDGQRLLTGSF